MALQTFSIAGQKISKNNRPFIIAELSGNHGGDIEKAKDLVLAAVAAGVSAIKIQTYTADTITFNSDRPEFKLETGLWAGRSLHELYDEAHTPWEWHAPLFELSKKHGVPMFSSPFDHSAVDFLESLNTPAYKIASYEVVDIPLIQKVARTGKPMIISSGMATKQELQEAIAAFRGAGGKNIALLHCVSGYPTPISDSNLMTMVDKSQDLEVDVIGLSDHTPGINVPIAAVALGARIIEKHLCLSRAGGEVDSAFSLEPDEFKALVIGCNQAFEALGKVNYELKPSEIESRATRRSLYIVEDLAAGDVIKVGDVRSIRPANGIHTRYLDAVIGKRAKINIAKGTPLAWDLLE